MLEYNNGINMIRALRAGKIAGYGGGADCRGDAFFDTSGINAAESSGEMHDIRGAYEPTRCNGENIYTDNMATLSGWTGITVGTGTVSVVADSAPDPAVGDVFKFATGSTVGGIGGAQKDVGSIPAAYGILFLVNLNAVGTNPADALTIAIGNVNGYNALFRLYDGAIQTFQDGGWRTLLPHGGAFWTEWWIQVTQTAGASHRVDLYAGTQLVGTRTGSLPGGGVDGLVVFQQLSGATANRESRIGVFHVGTSQLADNISLVSKGYPARVSPETARAVFVIEDTSASLAENTNLTLQLSQNGGVTWESATLARVDNFSLGGPVDPTKNALILVAEHTFANVGARNLAWRLQSSGNWWFALMGAYMEWA